MPSHCQRGALRHLLVDFVDALGMIVIKGPALATAGLATEGRTGPAQILLISGKGCKHILLLKAGLTLLTRVLNHYMVAVPTPHCSCLVLQLHTGTEYTSSRT